MAKMPDMTLNVHVESDIIGAVEVKPGDKILLIAKDHLSADTADQTRKHVSARFPEAEFTIIDGTFTVVIQRAE